MCGPEFSEEEEVQSDSEHQGQHGSQPPESTSSSEKNSDHDSHSGGDPVFGYDGKARSIPVQPVAAPENEGFLLFPEIPGQSIGQGVVRVLEGRMQGHAGRFVHDHQIFIFIEDSKR